MPDYNVLSCFLVVKSFTLQQINFPYTYPSKYLKVCDVSLSLPLSLGLSVSFFPRFFVSLHIHARVINCISSCFANIYGLSKTNDTWADLLLFIRVCTFFFFRSLYLFLARDVQTSWENILLAKKQKKKTKIVVKTAD